MTMNAPQPHKNPEIFESDAIALVALIDNEMERLRIERKRIVSTYMPTAMDRFTYNGRIAPMRVADVLVVLRSLTESRLRLVELIRKIVLAANEGTPAHPHPLNKEQGDD